MLRLALREQDLANHFQIAQSLIANTQVNFMSNKFKEVPIWPCRVVIDNFMPESFRSMYSTTQCINDTKNIYSDAI